MIKRKHIVVVGATGTIGKALSFQYSTLESALRQLLHRP